MQNIVSYDRILVLSVSLSLATKASNRHYRDRAARFLFCFFFSVAKTSLSRAISLVSSDRDLLLHPIRPYDVKNVDGIIGGILFSFFFSPLFLAFFPPFLFSPLRLIAKILV